MSISGVMMKMAALLVMQLINYLPMIKSKALAKVMAVCTCQVPMGRCMLWLMHQLLAEC